jgi:hypothetical protein
LFVSAKRRLKKMNYGEESADENEDLTPTEPPEKRKGTDQIRAAPHSKAIISQNTGFHGTK